MNHPTNLNSSSAQLHLPQSNTSMEAQRLYSHQQRQERNMNQFVQAPFNQTKSKQVFYFILFVFIAIQIISVFYIFSIHDSIKSLHQKNEDNQGNINSLQLALASTQDSHTFSQIMPEIEKQRDKIEEISGKVQIGSTLSERLNLQAEQIHKMSLQINSLEQLIPQIEKQGNKIEEISGKVKEGSTIQEQLKSQAEQIQKMSLNINTLQAITPLIQKHADEVEDLKVKVSVRGDSKDVEDLKIHVAILEQVVKSMKDQSEEVSKIRIDLAVLSARFGLLDSSKISEDMINLKISMRENQIVLDSYKSQFSDIKVNSDSIESIKSSLTIVQSNLAQAQKTLTSVIPTLATITQVKNYVANLQNQITNLDSQIASISSTSSSGSGSSSGSTNTTGSSDTDTSSDPTDTSSGTTDSTDTSTNDTSNSSDSTTSTSNPTTESTGGTSSTTTTTTQTTTSSTGSTSTSRSVQLLELQTTRFQTIIMTIFNNYFTQIETKKQILIDTPTRSIVTFTATGYGYCASCHAQLSFLKNRLVSLPQVDSSTLYYGSFFLREILQSISLTQEFKVEKGLYEFYLGIQAFPNYNKYTAYISSLAITIKVTPID